MKNTCNASVEPLRLLPVQSHKRHQKTLNGGYSRVSVLSATALKAFVSDDQGLIEMLSDNIDYFKFKPVNTPKITILLKMRISPPKIGGTVEKSLSSDHE